MVSVSSLLPLSLVLADAVADAVVASPRGTTKGSERDRKMRGSQSSSNIMRDDAPAGDSSDGVKSNGDPRHETSLLGFVTMSPGTDEEAEWAGLLLPGSVAEACVCAGDDLSLRHPGLCPYGGVATHDNDVAGVASPALVNGEVRPVAVEIAPAMLLDPFCKNFFIVNPINSPELTRDRYPVNGFRLGCGTSSGTAGTTLEVVCESIGGMDEGVVV